MRLTPNNFQVMSARDRAKARALQQVTGALHDVYNDLEEECKGGEDEWLHKALQDDLLDDGEVAYIKATRPEIVQKQAAGTRWPWDHSP